MSVVRHFTATAYVVHEGRVALHWHPKVKAWLPPGGHVEENEDPVQAVLRETEEETGLKTAVVPTGPAIDLSYPVIVQPPLTIMVEDIHDPVDGYHQHIDLIYISRPVGTPGPMNDGWVWVSEEELADGDRPRPGRRAEGAAAGGGPRAGATSLRAGDGTSAGARIGDDGRGFRITVSVPMFARCTPLAVRRAPSHRSHPARHSACDVTVQS